METSRAFHFRVRLCNALAVAVLVLCAGQPGIAQSRLEVFTSDNQPGIASDAIGLRLTGPVPEDLDRQLRRLLMERTSAVNHAVLELDSEGGELGSIRSAALVLKEFRQGSELTTRVLGGGVCASGCVALFMQGAKRKASGASVWVFHGACSRGTNIPSYDATLDYLNLLDEAGVSREFLCSLLEQGYVSRPGQLFLSGYELMHVHKAGIITELLPPWQPEAPVGLQLMVPR